MFEELLKVEGWTDIEVRSPAVTAVTRVQEPLAKVFDIEKAHDRPGRIAAIPAVNLQTVAQPMVFEVDVGTVQPIDAVVAVRRYLLFDVAFDQFRDHPVTILSQGRQLAQTERNSVVLR